ncbi:MAG TPA: sugar ABC transporter ATP-binding protein [Chthoniobacterales bacterium]
MVDRVEPTPALRIVGVSKSYGASRALSEVTFDIRRGAVHALVGENGAGKSTLVKIITGIVPADAGQVFLGSQAVHFATPMEARAGGIAAVYQDPKLFAHLDVAENIFLGNYPTSRLGTVDRRRMYTQASAALGQLGLELDPHSLVAGLSVAELQFVEIARALSAELQLLILDEPTSALTPAESERLFRIVRTLRDRGKSILLITHRLEEVESMADDLTVLRDGRHVATRPAREVDRAALVQMMVGRPVETLFGRSQSTTAGNEVLRVEDLGVEGTFAGITFSLRAREIVGMAGLVGAGRTEIAQTVFGITPPTRGRVFLNGQPVVPRSPRQMLKLGVAYLPEDRDGQGLIMADSIVNNVTLPIVGRLARMGVLNGSGERRVATQAAATYDVKAISVEQLVMSLSGGNRQKVAFAKWLATTPVALLLDEPTHGIDIGSKAQVHRIIRQLADQGLAVLLISSDLPEVLAMSDRILVIAEGRLVAEIPREEATQEKVMMAATQGAGTSRACRPKP